MLSYDSVFDEVLNAGRLTENSEPTKILKKAMEMFSERKLEGDFLRKEIYISEAVDACPPNALALTSLGLLIMACYENKRAEHYKNLLEEVCKEQNKKEAA